MTTRPPRLWRSLSLAVLAILVSLQSFTAAAQSNSLTNGFTLDFVKPDGVASVDDVVTNVVRAVNRTARPIRFSLDIASPADWRLVNNRPEKLYVVRPGDSTFVPVRLIPAKNSVGNVNYFISATAYSEFGNALASTPWSVSVQKISKWNFFVEERQVYFTNDSDSSGIHVKLENKGNSIEKLRLRLYPDKRLQVLGPDGKEVRENAMFFQMPSGTDTSFVMSVRVRENTGKGYFFSDSPDDTQDKEVAKKFRLQIQASSTDDKNRVKGRRVDFVKLTSLSKMETNFGGAYIPITAELRSFNVLSEFTNFNLDLRGVTDLGKRRFLQYNYQTIISTGIAGTQVNSANQFIQYSSPTMTVAAGNIGENMGVFISGNGAKGSFRWKNLEVGALYAQNASRGSVLAPNDLTYYAGRLQYDGKKGTDVEVQYINQYDNFNLIDGNIYRLQANVKINRRHRLRLLGGYSTQEDQFNQDSVYTVSGYGAELRYAGGIGKLNFSFNGTYYSDLFLTQQNGIQRGTANFRYALKGSKSINLRGTVSEINRTVIRRGIRFQNPTNRRDFFELRYQWRKNGATFLVGPNYRFDELLGLKVQTTGGSIGFSKSQGRLFRVYSRFFAGVSKAPEFEVSPYPVARWENRVRYKNLNVMVRYNYGPATILENFRVIEDRLTPQSLFMTANASLYFRKQRFQVQPRLNIRYESLFARWRSNISSDFIYYANSGYVFTVGLEFLNIKQGESPLALRSQQQGFDGLLEEFTQTTQFLRFGIRKEFKIKRPGGKAFDLKVVVFKDADGNGVKDLGEELVENVLLKINDKAVITDRQGQAEFKNLIFGNYLVESDVLGDTEGWFKTDDNSIIMDKSKTLYIPLSRGVQVTGTILLQKASYSRFLNDVDLSGIRISAVGADDKVYSGITDRQGQFRIFVPFGQYQVKASSASIDEQFQFAQDTYELSIDNAEANFQITYYLIEKRRKLNIKRFDNN